ncbi:GNAT family N-acetyltransferase [Phanerochaete sordida]|uniref:GNAT family N-acetyltransferase n=1 Tax=Phanerochaete sordida TaxID=48140 RepID=A0A9P3GSS3_9APHY|nr:GNAT family N-acetyltransferase [Phanerochaete sordida]
MATADVKILQISSEDTVPLRHAVLWPDKPQSYVLLPEDSAGHHLGAFLDEAEPAVAVISLFVEPLPSSASEAAAAESLRADTITRAARFRKFACHPAHQGRGIGTALLAATFDAARELGCTVIWCDGRLDAAPWYEKRGMQRFGDTFFKGPIEYVRMKADL